MATQTTLSQQNQATTTSDSFNWGAALTIVSAKFPEQFDTAHLTVGQIVFIVATLCLWITWITWATRDVREVHARPAD